MFPPLFNIIEMKAFVFPGQGAQFSGMGKDLYQNFTLAKELFEQANDILGFSLSNIMFEGSEEELKQTKVTQPAVFLHSYIAFRCLATEQPNMVAGHSLGEFTALAANGCLRFEDALTLVSHRAHAMQRACDCHPSGMAVVLKFDHAIIENVCQQITEEVVVPANYNSPQQLVISGSMQGLSLAMEKLREQGARKMMLLNVGGAFHSPLMQPAQEELATAIEQCTFHTPSCPIYQNSTAVAAINPTMIKDNLLKQLTHPVRWIESVQNMAAAGATDFVEFGPGETLQGLIKRILPQQ